MSGIPRINTQFLPILLKGHERSITTVKYNGDGDLIFTAAKDLNPTVWYSDTGERLGTYGFHRGAVLDIDPSWDSKYVITASGDGSARLFETTTGQYVARMPHEGAVRAVAWSECNKQFCTASDPFTSRDLGTINIFDFPEDGDLAEPQGGQDPAPLHMSKIQINVDDNDKGVCLGWTIGNKFIIAGFDTGVICKYDATTGEEVQRSKPHVDRVNRISFNRDKSLMITASKDCTSCLMDPNSLEVIRTYKTDRPVNGAVISPTHPHVLMGGGQDAQTVTTTSAGSGKFETRFFHMIYGDEFGRVKGHFGPINALSVHPFGKSFASGSEDGFIRVHAFDANYMNAPDHIPHDLKKSEAGTVFGI
jgi:translation initiation factor 3 subunit I